MEVQRIAIEDIEAASRNAVIEECAAKMDVMEAKNREDQQDDKETYEAMHRADAFHFAARILRNMKK